MTRHAFKVGAIAVAATLVLPSFVFAYFPPTIGMPPVGVQSVPPDPFPVPGVGGLGEPDAPDPGVGPTVQTPEPASLVTALMGLVMAGGYGLRKRLKAHA